jgi:hypothetical protein
MVCLVHSLYVNAVNDISRSLHAIEVQTEREHLPLPPRHNPHEHPIWIFVHQSKCAVLI